MPSLRLELQLTEETLITGNNLLVSQSCGAPRRRVHPLPSVEMGTPHEHAYGTTLAPTAFLPSEPIEGMVEKRTCRRPGKYFVNDLGLAVFQAPSIKRFVQVPSLEIQIACTTATAWMQGRLPTCHGSPRRRIRGELAQQRITDCPVQPWASSQPPSLRTVILRQGCWALLGLAIWPLQPTRI